MQMLLVWFWISLIAISLGILQKNFSCLLLLYYRTNIALEVGSEALDSINTSKLKNIRGRLALLTWEHTYPAGSNKPV